MYLLEYPSVLKLMKLVLASVPHDYSLHASCSELSSDPKWGFQFFEALSKAVPSGGAR